MKKVAWIIIDNKVGNANQAISVAKAMGVEYIIKSLKYNFLACLPNWLKFDSLLGINLSKSSNLNEPYPDIIISSGRKTASVSSYLKKQNPQIFTMHLMHPDLPFKNFDLVCLPLHDKCQQFEDYNNIFYTIGAPSYLDFSQIEQEGKNLLKKFKNLKPPFISLMIGGTTKKGEYKYKELETLVKQANKLANNINAALLITTSRRTNPEFAKSFEQHITVPYFLYDWHKMKALENPYSGFLSLSDHIIVTGDSVSICSEALHTGKSVYIYRNDSLLSSKHIKFLDYLVELGYTKTLQQKDLKLEKWDYPVLQEAQKVAKAIEEKIKNVNTNISI